MANYAMVSNSEVIEVLHNVHEKPNWPMDTEGNVVHSIECSEDVERGMAYKTETGEFYWPEPITPEPTQMDRIEEMLNSLTSGTISADSISEAVLEGVNEV